MVSDPIPMASNNGRMSSPPWQAFTEHVSGTIEKGVSDIRYSAVPSLAGGRVCMRCDAMGQPNGSLSAECRNVENFIF